MHNAHHLSYLIADRLRNINTFHCYAMSCSEVFEAGITEVNSSICASEGGSDSRRYQRQTSRDHWASGQENGDQCIEFRSKCVHG